MEPFTFLACRVYAIAVSKCQCLHHELVELTEDTLAMSVFEDAFDVLTVEQCQILFSHLERHADQFTEV